MNICGCKACGGPEARDAALRLRALAATYARLREARARLNPDGALANRNPMRDDRIAESMHRDALDAWRERYADANG